MVDCTGGAWMRGETAQEMDARHLVALFDDDDFVGVDSIDAPEFLPTGSTTIEARNDAPSRE